MDSIKEIQDPEHDGMKDSAGLMGKKRQTVFLSLFQLKLERPTIRFDDGISERDRIYRRLKSFRKNLSDSSLIEVQARFALHL